MNQTQSLGNASELSHELRIVPRSEWIATMAQFVEEEKQWTRMRDRLAAKRRSLPWVRVEDDYEFESGLTMAFLSERFQSRSQLIIYHSMFSPNWDAGCLGCSLLCDQIGAIRTHLEQKDLRWVAASRAPICKILAYQDRMGWTFPSVSSANSTFNLDFAVFFPCEEQRREGLFYNFRNQPDPGTEELPELRVFTRALTDEIYRTYSSYDRGAENFDTVVSWLGLLPRGRQERSPGERDWVRRKDEYGASSHDDLCCSGK